MITPVKKSYHGKKKNEFLSIDSVILVSYDFSNSNYCGLIQNFVDMIYNKKYYYYELY